MSVIVSRQFKLPKSYDPVFANNSWEDIIAACQSGKVPDTWKVGDQKTMSIPYDTMGFDDPEYFEYNDYRIDIIGKNHDTYSDGTGKAPLTFQLHEVYSETYIMHDSNSNYYGWDGCTMRKEYLPTILNRMPTEVKNAIRKVNKLTGAGNASYTIKTTSDDLFLLSAEEVTGSAANSASGEGVQYEYYKTRAFGKFFVSDTSESGSGFWWSRSPSIRNATSYCYIKNDGQAYTPAQNNQAFSFAFCF